ncbi:MAG: hypothetical protein JW938_00490 [Candidatus Omnitrophica bacterium]|nr:hypothetical protein [Candidatus Omnitrophota bacterium]
MIVPVGGCAGKMNAYDAVHNGFYSKAMHEFNKDAYKQEKYLKKKNKYDKDYALPYLHLASAGFEGGAYSLAETALMHALPVMQRMEESGGQNLFALVTTEDQRQYKGDPYERSAANFYLGLIRFYNGEHDRALALFRRALVSDMDTKNKEEEALEDYTVAQIMAAKTYAILGEMDNAKVMLDRAEEYIEDKVAFTEFKEHFLTDNFTVLIANGIGPFKMSCGAGKAAIKVDCDSGPVRKMDIYIDEKRYGSALKAMDVTEQAEQHTASFGRRSVQAFKGTCNQITSVAMGLKLMGSKSDSRSWILLPNGFYIFSTTIDPGLHTVMLKCFDKKGKELPRYEQRWFYIPVVEGKEGNLLILRTGIDKCNQYKKIKRQRVLTKVQRRDVKKWK